MSANAIHRDMRSLAQIESDLVAAEATFANADARCKEAERERQDAFDRLNVHQVELDDAIAQLRERSIPGSRWRPDLHQAGAVPILELDDSEAEPSGPDPVAPAADDAGPVEIGAAPPVPGFAGYNPWATASDHMSAEEITSRFFYQAPNRGIEIPVPGFEFRNFAPIEKN